MKFSLTVGGLGLTLAGVGIGYIIIEGPRLDGVLAIAAGSAMAYISARDAQEELSAYTAIVAKTTEADQQLQNLQD